MQLSLLYSWLQLARWVHQRSGISRIVVAIIIVFMSLDASVLLGQISAVPVTPVPMARRGPNSPSELIGGRFLQNMDNGRTDGLYAVYYPPSRQSAGYQRWMVKIGRVDGRNFTRDDEIRFRLDFRRIGSGWNTVDSIAPSYEETLQLKQGNSEAITSFLLPVWAVQSWHRIRFYSSTGELHGLASNWDGGGWANQGDNISALWVHYDDVKEDRYIDRAVDPTGNMLRSLRNARVWAIHSDVFGWVNSGSMAQYGNQQPALSIALASRLPSNWLEYTSFGWVWIPIDILEALPSAQADALRTYTNGGGTLVVTRWKSEYSVERISNWFGNSGAQENSTATVDSELQRSNQLTHLERFNTWWDQWVALGDRNVFASYGYWPGQLPAVDDGGRTSRVDHWLNKNAVLAAASWLDWKLYPWQAMIVQMQKSKSGEASVKRTSDLLYQLRNNSQAGGGQIINVGFGKVICLGIDRMEQMDQVGRLKLETAARDTALRSQRLGINELGESGENYWRWLIPSVGKPPVWSFGALVAFFAAIAGPFILVWTNRIRRQTWLLILFPSLAIISTALLFSYAIMRDGFSTTTRVRSFTLYDAASKTGFAWSRQTFFSGMPPRAGLQFRMDSEVTPVETTDATGGLSGINTGTLEWSEGSQVYRSLLRPRQQSQFLVRHPVESLSLFERQSLADANAGHRIKNISSNDWLYVCFVDQHGDHWVAENVPAGQDITLQKENESAVHTLMQSIMNEYDLSLPDGLEIGQRMSMIQWFNRSRYYAGVGGNARGQPLMETKMQALLGLRSQIPKSSFVVISKTGDHIDRPVSTAKEVDSIHIVAGSW